MANFTAGTSFTDGVTNDVTALKLNALIADAVPTSNLSLNSTTGTIATFNSTTGTIATLNSTTPTFLGAITASTNTINVGSGQIYKDASGNVGVGTASPSSPLVVSRNANDNLTRIILDNPNAGSSAQTILGLSNDGGTAAGLKLGSSTYSGAGGANALDLFNNISHTIFSIGGTERLRIDSSGNVGVGTASPTVKLDVNGAINATSNSTLQGLNIGRGGGSIASNTSLGASALSSNTTGVNNTASGLQALYSNTTGDSNTASGVSALSSSTTGSRNVASGYLALQSNTTGANNTAIGVNALGSNTTGTNSSGFGQDAQANGSNQVQLGNSATTVYAYGAVQDRSDIRDKSDIRNTTLGLGFINALRPVDFKWDMREDYRTESPAPVAKPTELKEDASDEDKAKYQNDLSQYNAYIILKDAWLEEVKLSNITHDGSKKRNRYHHGLIAQEVETLLNDSGIDFGGFQDHSIKGGDDVKSIGYGELIAPLIKAIQELSAKVTALEAK